MITLASNLELWTSTFNYYILSSSEVSLNFVFLSFVNIKVMADLLSKDGNFNKSTYGLDFLADDKLKPVVLAEIGTFFFIWLMDEEYIRGWFRNSTLIILVEVVINLFLRFFITHILIK